MKVRGGLWNTAILVVTLLFVYMLYRTFIYSPVIFGLRDDFKEAVPFQIIPSGLSGIRAEDCGICHMEIYEEWKTSYHARAFVDPFFQAFWRKDKNIWICLNCHSPLVNQQPWMIKGVKGGSIGRPVKETNSNYDGEFQKEGITCAACHLRDGVILGPYKDSSAPHPTKYDPRFRTTEICYSCHQVPGGPFQFYNGAPCATYLEFEENPYARKGYLCQTCHMPSVLRPGAVGTSPRAGGRHLWMGGHYDEMLKKAVEVKLEPDKERYGPGDTARFTLTLTNKGAGHKIPTGDPDRHYTVRFSIVNSDGKILKEKVYTIGRWILWWPVIVEVYENRVLPLKSYACTFEYRLPKNEVEGSHLIAEVTYHIMTERTHNKLKRKYGLTGDDPYSLVVYSQRMPLNVQD